MRHFLSAEECYVPLVVEVIVKRKEFSTTGSLACRIVENTFGVLARRWRVFHTKTAVMPRVCVKIVQDACILHNFLQRT